MADSVQVNPATNISALLRATTEFSFADGATTVLGALPIGFTPVGNIVGVTPALDTEKVEHFSGTRGVVRKDREDVTKTQVEFKVKVDELNRTNVKTMFGGTSGTSTFQASQTAQNCDALAFNTTNSVIGNWYDLRISGAIIRNATIVTVATLDEFTPNFDFEVDLLLGRIRFKAVQTASRVPVITAPAIVVDTSAYSFITVTPLQTTRRTGIGRLTLFDSTSGNNVPLDYYDFSCQITLDSVSEINPDKFWDMTISVLVTTTVGTVGVRSANRLTG